MISIRKTVDELEQLEELQRVTLSGYAMAISSAADYAVDVNESQAAAFRSNLSALRESLESARDISEVECVQPSFRGELRDYREQTNQTLERMREDLRCATAAMQTLSDTVANHGEDHEKQLRSDLDKLKKVAEDEDISRMRAAIRDTAASIAHSFQQMHNATRLSIALLNDEIRTLHREMNSERARLQTDRASGAWNRERMEGRMEHLLEQGDFFCTLFIRVANWKQIENACSRPVLEGALKSMVKRIYGLLGASAMVGRWSEQEFAVIVEIDPATALSLAAEISRQLSARYVVQLDGTSHALDLSVSSGVVDQQAGEDAHRFRARLEQLSSGLARTA